MKNYCIFDLQVDCGWEERDEWFGKMRWPVGGKHEFISVEYEPKQGQDIYKTARLELDKLMGDREFCIWYWTFSDTPANTATINTYYSITGRRSDRPS